MSVTVIDFGPVDWGKIWQDRAGLVSDAHLKELNSITNATHLSSPGYWRNLFASYPEVAQKAGLIAQTYVLPGRTPKAFTTNLRSPIITPNQANKQTQDKYLQTVHEIEDHRKEAQELEKHPFKKAFYIAKTELSESSVGQTVTQVVSNTVDVVGDLGQTVGNLSETTKDLSSFVRTITEQAKDLPPQFSSYVSQLRLVGAVVAGAYFLSKIT